MVYGSVDRVLALGSLEDMLWKLWEIEQSFGGVVARIYSRCFCCLDNVVVYISNAESVVVLQTSGYSN